MSLSIIYARDENHCIGFNGRLPWQLPDEFESFNRITQGHAIIMGRVSYEDHRSCLANRLNIVLTRQENYPLAAGVISCCELEPALSLAAEYSNESFIIGGVNLITANLTNADVVYETVVHAETLGDTFLPKFDFSNWHTEVLSEHPIDAKHRYSFTVYRHQSSVLSRQS